MLNEVAEEDLMNLPIRSFDKDKLQSSPLLQYILIRKQSVYRDLVIVFNCIEHPNQIGILYYLQEKRSHDYSPRLGRSSLASDEDESVAQLPPRNSNAPLFAPRLGKKALEFSPRLGRSFYSG